MPRYRYGLNDVMRAMNEVVDENPGKVDRRPSGGMKPRYAEHGECACLVGSILAQLGVEVRTLKALDREDETIEDSRHPFWNRFDPVARMLLASLQDGNDWAESWGRVRESRFTIRGYWFKEGPKSPYYHRAFPGPWCTTENALKITTY